MDCCLAQSWGSESCVITHLELRGSDNQFSLPPPLLALCSSISLTHPQGSRLWRGPLGEVGWGSSLPQTRSEKGSPQALTPPPPPARALQPVLDITASSLDPIISNQELPPVPWLCSANFPWGSSRVHLTDPQSQHLQPQCTTFPPKTRFPHPYLPPPTPHS